MNPTAEVWDKVVSLMRNEMTETTINTWFDDALPVSLDESSFTLYSPTRFKRDIIAAPVPPRHPEGPPRTVLRRSSRW